MRQILRDVAYSLRLLRRRPWLVLAIVVTIGGPIAIATLVSQALIAAIDPRLPFPDPDQLVRIRSTSHMAASERGLAQYVDFRFWHAQPRNSFVSMAASVSLSLDLTTSSNAQRTDVAFVSEDYFETLGITAWRGRTDGLRDRGQLGCAIGFRVWRTLFAGREDIIGQPLRLNHTIATVLAVLPPELDAWASPTEIWLGIGSRATFERSDVIERPGYFTATVIGRLAPTASLPVAEEEIAALVRARANEPHAVSDAGVRLVRLRDEERSAAMRRSVVLLQGATVLTLIVALANALGLLTAYAIERRPEMIVRQALGATRGDLRRVWTIESGLLIVGAACIGITGAFVLRRLSTGISGELTYLLSAAGARTSFAIAALTCFIVAVMLALIVGLVLARVALPIEGVGDPTRDVGAGVARGARLQGSLLIAQVAVATMLMAANGALLATLFALQRVDFGMDNVPGATVTFQEVHLPEYQFAASDLPARFDAIREALAARPGIRHVALASDVPVPGSPFTSSIYIEGQPDRLNTGRAPTPGRHYITPDHFRTLGVSLHQGRDFDSDDRAGSRRVAIVNQRMADLYWPHASALGKRLKFYRDDVEWAEVVGVVGDMRYGGVRGAIRPEVYSPLSQHPRDDVHVLLLVEDSRAASTEAAIPAQLRKVVPGIVLSTSGRLRDEVRALTASMRLASFLVCAFAGLALALAASGVYGLASQYVARRTREMAVRMAIGASPRDVLVLVLGGAIWKVAIGMGVGAAGALLVVAPLVRHYIDGVESERTLLIAAGVVLLALAGVLAAIGPGVRAARISPATTLRAG